MIDLVIIGAYFLLLLLIGVWSGKRVRNGDDFAVAGRRLGAWLYGGTMAAVVLGGASTIGGIGLGYQYGISGMWLVFAIGAGVLLLSLAFAGKIRRLRVYTVGEMLELRYGQGARPLTGVVMATYTLLICVVANIGCGTLLGAAFGLDKATAVALGGGMVILYSALGGMWSITLTDIIQFVIKSVGIFGLLLPIVFLRAGGFDGLHHALPASAFSLTSIGGDTILAYFVTYVPGLVIGQDIWQRIGTARDERIARWAGAAAGIYCLAYSLAGALIGMAARALLPGIADRNEVFAAIVRHALPTGLSGLVIAAALAAVMSTSSGALIATATASRMDILRRSGRPGDNTGPGAGDELAGEEAGGLRVHLVTLGLAAIAISWMLQDVIAALTIAYAVLVCGLCVPIIGGIVWRRANIQGAMASMVAGVATSLAVMAADGDIYASAPILFGLGASLIAYCVVSMMFAPPHPDIFRNWRERLADARRAGSQNP